MKALFTEKQSQVKYQPIGNGLVDVFICLNEKEYEIQIGMESEEKQIMYEYDFNQFRISDALISEDDIKSNPSEYLDYKPLVDSIPQLRADVDFLKIAGGYDV